MKCSLRQILTSKDKGVTKQVTLLILTVCLIIAGCGYYWFETVYQPNQRLIMATTLINKGQESDADQAFRSFISDYPQHAKVAFAYGKLFELNFKDKAKSAELLKVLKEKYPSSEEYANSLAKTAAREIDTFKPLYDNYYNTGLGKEKYYPAAKNLLDELNTQSDSSAFIKVGGNELITKLNTIVNPPFGAIEFKLALSDYTKIEVINPNDKPKVTLSRGDGTLAEVQYDKGVGIVSAKDLAPGNYRLEISLIRGLGASQRNYFGGELITVVSGRKFKDTTYLFLQNKTSSNSDNIDRRYLALDNNPQTVVAKQITASSNLPIPKTITKEVLPKGYSVPANDHYLFDLDNDGQNELIAYYQENRSLVVLHWNGEAFEEQAKFQIGSSDSKLDFSMYPISIKLYTLEGNSFPVLGLITTSGDSGSYPELTLLNWNGKDAYNILWDATAGENGNWKISQTGIIMSQDNFGVRSNAQAKTRFMQEYEYDGTNFVLKNSYSS